MILWICALYKFGYLNNYNYSICHSGLSLHDWTKGYPDSVYESLAQHKVCVRHVHKSFQENLSSH